VTPAARLQTAIELVDEILESVHADGAAADTIIVRSLRNRRYAGSKDRTAIRALVYCLLRDDGALLDGISGRALAARMALTAEHAWRALFGAGGYAPAALSESEIDQSQLPVGSTQKSFLQVQLHTAFHNQADEEFYALLQRADIDLRVGASELARQTALEKIRESGVVDAAPTHYSSWGVRLPADTHLPSEIMESLPHADVQDEGSQIIALLTSAQPGETVIDLCAGAGGKTLALAAMMHNQGTLVAHDIDARRLERLAPRAGRAHASEFIVLRSDSLDDLAGTADCVLVDAPCSGSGTWRRNPEARLRPLADRLPFLQKIQRNLIAQAAHLARKGGRIIYAVCSWMVEEGEGHLAHLPPGLAVTDWRSLWPTGQPQPETASSRPDCLKLTPYRHGCDGFFIVCLQKL
jgi:16S rRNA (cytosine967-C5)-methyltransferase